MTNPNEDLVNGNPCGGYAPPTIVNYGKMQYVGFANTVNFNCGADSLDAASEQPLMAYISDPQRRAEVSQLLASVTDLKTLCRSVLYDVYCMEMNDLKDKDKIIVSRSFIESFTPMMTSYRGSREVPNIRAAIHKYLLEKE